MSLQQALVAWERLCAAGDVPRWTTPSGFSEYLVKVQLTPSIAREVDEAVSRQMTWRSYRAAFQRYMSAVAPGGVWAARGLHSVSVRTAEEALGLVEGRWTAAASFSFNLAYAVDRFGSPTVSSSLLAENLSSGYLQARDNLPAWQATIEEWLNRERARPTKTNIGKAAAETQCSIVLVAKLPLSALEEFGGDSESGPLQEAEVKVSAGLPLRTLAGVFVCAPWPIRGGRVATVAERRQFALSDYTRVAFISEVHGFPMPGETVLHSDVAPRAPWLKRSSPVTTVREAFRRGRPQSNIDRYRWFRIV